MSVTETKKIDAMGISGVGDTLILLITDHLDWENEAEHLLMLQEKINAYLGFIEFKQYAETYPDATFDCYVIDVRCKYEATDKCLEFLDVVNAQLREYSIQVILNKF